MRILLKTPLHILHLSAMICHHSALLIAGLSSKAMLKIKHLARGQCEHYIPPENKLRCISTIGHKDDHLCVSNERIYSWRLDSGTGETIITEMVGSLSAPGMLRPISKDRRVKEQINKNSRSGTMELPP